MKKIFLSILGLTNRLFGLEEGCVKEGVCPDCGGLLFEGPSGLPSVWWGCSLCGRVFAERYDTWSLTFWRIPGHKVTPLPFVKAELMARMGSTEV